MRIPLEQAHQANEDMAHMYEWYETIGTGVDISSPHQEYSEVNWFTFSDWVRSRLK